MDYARATASVLPRPEKHKVPPLLIVLLLFFSSLASLFVIVAHKLIEEFCGTNDLFLRWI
jgi:hypothetical protein